MLRRECAEGWFLIAQHDHSQLAYEVMKSWGAQGFYVPERFDEVSFAIREHDCGWSEWDRAPRVNPCNRFPASFMEMDSSDQVAIWERCFTLYSDTHPYASALIALHFSVFNERNLAKDPGNRAAKGLRERIRRMVRDKVDIALGEPLSLASLPKPVRSDLRLLQIGDIISLALCHGWRSRRIDHTPVDPPTENCALHMSSQDGFNYRISPYPFREAEMRVQVPGRRLSRRDFGDGGELRREVERASVEALIFTITQR